MSADKPMTKDTPKDAAAVAAPIGAINLTPNEPSRFDPEVRLKTARDARQRQRVNQPAKPLNIYAVALADGSGKVDADRVEAIDENEAWAKFCDGRKHTRGPHSVDRTIAYLGTKSDVQARLPVSGQGSEVQAKLEAAVSALRV
jgi:hypothetical protein